MGTKVYGNYEDLITFTRASKGHALRPVSYGSEEVTNGDFATDSDWVKTQATISGGVCEINSPSGSYAGVYQAIPVTVGKMYFISVEVVSVVTGSALVNVEGGSVGTLTTSGFITTAYVATDDTLTVEIKRGGGVTEFTIDNVSVKEVTFDESDGTLTLFEHPDNTPRVEWDAQRNRLGLLVEAQRTNLVQYSEDFNNAAWIDTRGDVVSVTITDPAGQQNAFSWTSNDSAESYLSDNTTISSGATVTFSGFVKKNTTDYCHLLVWDASANGCRVWFDLDNGQVGTNTSFGSTFTVSGSSITEHPNGWYRCSMTVATSGSTTAQVRFQPSDGDGVGASSVGKSIYIYGAQLEQASFPTSYIKTTGATATRSVDAPDIQLANFGYNHDKGTVLVEFSQDFDYGSTGFPRAFEIGDPSTERVNLFVNTSTGTLVAGANFNNLNQAGMVLKIEADGRIDTTKVAYAFADDDFAASDDGETVVTDTSGTFSGGTPRTKLLIGPSNFCGHIKSIKYYPRRLTNAQLEDLSS